MLRNGVTIPESASILALWQPENFPQIFRRMNKPNLILPMANLAKTLSCHCFFLSLKNMYNNGIILYTDLYVYIYIYIYIHIMTCIMYWMVACQPASVSLWGSLLMLPAVRRWVHFQLLFLSRKNRQRTLNWVKGLILIYIYTYVRVFVLFVVCYRRDIMYMTYRYIKILIVYSLYIYIYILKSRRNSFLGCIRDWL